MDEDYLRRTGQSIVESLRVLGFSGRIEGILPGPVITLFELKPEHPIFDPKLAARFQVQIPYRTEQRFTNGSVTVEVPNPSRTAIALRPLLETPTFKRLLSPLSLALGVNTHSQPFFLDLANSSNLLMVGKRGSGLQAMLRSIITSLIYKAGTREAEILLVDPGEEVFAPYRSLPHLRTELIGDPSLAIRALIWAVREMERRYRLLASLHVRSIAVYNDALEKADSGRSVLRPLVPCVLVVTELSALVDQDAKTTVTSLSRLAQMGRSVGLHQIICTREVTNRVLSDDLLVNFPFRLSLKLENSDESRLALGQAGAEALLGEGDSLLVGPTSTRPVRLHGACMSTTEMDQLASWFDNLEHHHSDPEVLRAHDEPVADHGPTDPLYTSAASLVIAEQKASASLLQRRLRIGYRRAAKLVDALEAEHVIDSAYPGRPRDVLVGDRVEGFGNHQEGRAWRVEKEAGTLGHIVPVFASRADTAGIISSPKMARFALNRLHWDAFISHASEDKEVLVRPLVAALRRRGVQVWYDEFTLTVGDSLRRSIDAGLAGSRYGIVILSPSFLAKEWPRKELDALVARETGERKVILPVWHNVEFEDVRMHSPILADRLAVASNIGIAGIVTALISSMDLAS